MKEIRHLSTIKINRNMNTKQHLLQNDQNADMTLLHSHDDLDDRYTKMVVSEQCLFLDDCFLFFLKFYLFIFCCYKYYKAISRTNTHLFVKNVFLLKFDN